MTSNLRLDFLLVLLAALGSLVVGRGASAQQPAEADDPPSIVVEPGSGAFEVPGGTHPERRITVHYHRPDDLAADAPVVMVIPGAGRNGDEYRDAWVEASEEHGLLVLSPSYPERHYPEYWSYNLAGMTDRVTLELGFVVDTDPAEWRLDDVLEELGPLADPHELFGHSARGHLLHGLMLLELVGMLEDVEIRGTDAEPDRDPDTWIFDDFDRIFERVRSELELETETYDLFGHSAGGQILHRLVLFAPSERHGRILAANAGWYTVPTREASFPYGMEGTGLTDAELEEAFAAELVVFLGEEDDADETRGSLRRTPAADRQGAHRLARGTHFYRTARATADSLGLHFSWERVVVPGVGHDYERMSEAAAEHLYGRSASDRWKQGARDTTEEQSYAPETVCGCDVAFAVFASPSGEPGTVRICPRPGGHSLTVAAASVLDASHVDSVAVGPSDVNGMRSVDLRLTEEGARQLEESLRIDPAVELAVVLDGEVISQFTPRGSGGSHRITVLAKISPEHAHSVASRLRAAQSHESEVEDALDERSTADLMTMAAGAAGLVVLLVLSLVHVQGSGRS